ncbi:YidC/Oxa1 family membrane protein insertase [Crassaminicella indica]|uniref:YidC/Oxa1 family membrane protein insertase n=1 Tax=Crassaminicella indica TaxID=2855394 RepID=A0ABX8RDF6_9CLOT|nr:YidC/Oxa1 family membrane protein insertase [Crassaminicella indica]QXM07114.1 YidC/Oxa1 family membrane protein insertase [Crassaminicella indica]
MDIIINIFNMIYDFTNDYGIAIVIFTLLVKLMMLPLTIKQKKALKFSQEISIKVSALKEKYSANQEKLQQEITKLYLEHKGMSFGFLLMFLQMPIFYILYRLFSTNIIDTGTVLTPWLFTLSKPDPYFILPIIYILLQILPSLLQHFNVIKNNAIPKLTISTFITPIIVALLVTVKLPAGLGLYFVTNTIITNIEQILLKV